MGINSKRLVPALLVSGLLVLGPILLCSELQARSSFGFSSSRGFSSQRAVKFDRNSSWSPATRGTWNRSGGGFFGGSPQSSGGYSKPSTKEKADQGYSKPSPTQTQSSGGYAKPSTPGSPPSGGTGAAVDQRSSSSGYSKPTSPSGTPPAEAKPGGTATSGGYAKPGASRAATEKFTGGSKFDKQVADQERKRRSLESLQSYKAEQAKFKNTAAPVDPSQYGSSPLLRKGKVYTGFDYGTHYQQRDNFYRAQGYRQPAYAFGGSSSFGMFDSLFLFWMLNNMGNRNVAATAYHHSDDPGFQKWRQEVENLSKDNPDLKAKLAEMDKQIKALQGTPKDPAYLPPGVPPEIALAATALASKKPEKAPLRFAGGQSGGWYEKYGTLLQKTASGLDVKVISTKGSLENLKLLLKGDADIAVVQSDALALAEKKFPGKNLVSEQASLYVEYAQLIANRHSGVKSLRDLDPRKHVVYVGPMESGTALTWVGLCEQEPRYKKIPVKYADYAAALAEVERNKNSLMLFVGGLNSSLLNTAEEEAKKSENIRLVEIQDRHFADKKDKNGNPIYRYVDIASNIYPYLQKGWIFSGDVKTLGVQAVLVLRTEWAAKFGPESMDALSAAILETKPEIQKMVNGAAQKTGSLFRGPANLRLALALHGQEQSLQVLNFITNNSKEMAWQTAGAY